MATNGEWKDLVSEFFDYTEQQNTSEIHRLWCGIALVGGALGRRVWALAAGNKRTYTNLYTMLVGPPGSGKGIIDEVKLLWREARNPTGGEAFKVAPDSVTRASLIDDLAKADCVHQPKIGPVFIYHSLLVASEEFQVLLPTFDPGMVSVLNALWNNKEEHHETRRHGPAKDVKISRPQLNILGGMQPSYLAEFPESTWNTGLIRRILMVYSAGAPIKPLFGTTKGIAHKKQALLDRLGQLSLLYGQMKWTADAANKIATWHIDGGPPTPTHAKLQYYNHSRTEFVIKLAVISAISRTAQFVIELEDVDRGIDWLLQAEKYMPDVFRAMLGKSDMSILEELHYFLMDLWRKQKKAPIAKSSIYHFLSSRATSDRIDRLVYIAESSNIIVRVAGTETWLPRAKNLHGVE